MAGIAGIVDFSANTSPVQQVRRMVQDMRRGTAGAAVTPSGPAALFRQQHPHEQTITEEGWLIDGRLCNTQPPHWCGTNTLLQLDGSFSLAKWDGHTLWLARDSFGTRPLFWASTGRKIAFCSEIPPLLSLPWVSREIDADQIAEYLSFRYVHAPRTLFRDVHAVPPGHAIRFDHTGVHLDRWYTPRMAEPGTPIPDERESVERIDHALRRAVERRLPRDQRATILLSGGLDSSAILFHTTDRVGPRPLAYTVALERDPADESPFAARVAKVMNAEHRLIRVDGQQMAQAVDECSRVMAQPLPSASAVLQSILYQHIASSGDNPIVLTGEGGDEVLGGRVMTRIARQLRSAWLMGQLPHPLRRGVQLAARRTGHADLAASWAHFGRDRNIGGSAVFHSAERVEILRDPGLVRPGIRRVVLDPFYQEVDSDPINSILHVWRRGWLPEDSLARTDRMANAAGIELLFPLLDRRLVAAADSLPGEAKVVRKGAGFVTKWPLRRAMEDRLPRPFTRRPKRSLPNPMGRWLAQSGSNFLRERVDTISQDPNSLFSAKAVQRLAREHLAGKRNHGLKLWTLALFQSWREQFGR